MIKQMLWLRDDLMYYNKENYTILFYPRLFPGLQNLVSIHWFHFVFPSPVARGFVCSYALFKSFYV